MEQRPAAADLSPGDLTVAGSAIGRLPHSRETDVAVNRDARISGRQLVTLAYSGLCRLLLGLPTAALGVAVTWSTPQWISMVIGLVVLGIGGYLSWRGFSFLGDAFTRKVSYVTGELHGETKRYRNAVYYYMVVGPVWTWIWRKKVFDSLPFGLLCHAYYAPGSLHLLSIEPATEAEPHPSLSFGGDTAHAWDRLRWPWLVAAVAAFGLVAGVSDMSTAHPAQSVMVSGRLGDYHVVHDRSTTRYLHLEDSPEYVLTGVDHASPPLPDLYPYIGEQVDLYVIASDPDSDVIALRLRNTLYAGDLYLHPEHMFWDMIVSGAVVTVLSGAILALFVWWIFWVRKDPATGYR